MWPGPATGLSTVGTPGPRPRMGPRGGRHGLRRFLRPTGWPPAKPFPIATEGLRTGQMRAGLILRGPWAGGSRSAGQLCPGEQLEAAAWKQGVAVQGFSSRRASGPLPQAAECGPAPAPGPPKPRVFEGADWRPSQFLPAPGLLRSCPRNAWCRSPRPQAEGHREPVFQAGAGMFSRGAADSRAPDRPRPHSWCEAGQPASFFHAPVPAAAGSGEGRGRFL